MLRWALPLAVAGCLAAAMNSVNGQPTNTILKTVEVPLPSSAVVTPDNKYVYVVSNVYDALYRIDISTQTVESNTIALDGNPQLTAITPKGGEVLVANPVDGYNGGIWGVPGTVSLITGAESTTPSLKQVITGMGTYADCVGINPTGTQAWVGNEFEGDCSVINLSKNTVLRYPIQTGDGPVCIKFMPDGKHAYVVNFYDNTVDEINVATQLIVGNPIPVAEYPTHIAITPDGTKAYVSGFSGSVSVIDTASNTVTATIPITTSEYGNYWLGSAMTPDGLYLYVPNQNAQTVVMISTATDTVVGNPITLGQTPGTMAISPNGKFAYINQMYNWTVAIVQITGG